MTNLVKILDNGPMQLVGEFDVTDDKGQTLRPRKVLTLCRCGLSSNSPFCDASHEAAGFASCPRAPLANGA
ncbi:MAG TPA: CDGSH iron-sulfur domain-containing protein [Trinickia sp.]|jgi:CDGSH-type Zn-finger protein|nr:CDGSH iron-sulfur domain-containing protein [Trinickia sp.]